MYDIEKFINHGYRLADLLLCRGLMLILTVIGALHIIQKHWKGK